MLNVKRINKKFQPDYSRVIVKSHIPQEEIRRKRIIMRVLNIMTVKHPRDITSQTAATVIKL